MLDDSVLSYNLISFFECEWGCLQRLNVSKVQKWTEIRDTSGKTRKTNNEKISLIEKIVINIFRMADFFWIVIIFLICFHVIGMERWEMIQIQKFRKFMSFWRSEVLDFFICIFTNLDGISDFFIPKSDFISWIKMIFSFSNSEFWRKWKNSSILQVKNRRRWEQLKCDGKTSYNWIFSAFFSYLHFTSEFLFILQYAPIIGN